MNTIDSRHTAQNVTSERPPNNMAQSHASGRVNSEGTHPAIKMPSGLGEKLKSFREGLEGLEPLQVEYATIESREDELSALAGMLGEKNWANPEIRDVCINGAKDMILRMHKIDVAEGRS